MDRKELLRAWLRGKNYHLLDIKTGLDWWEGQISKGACPTDEDVLKIADDSHRETVRKGIGRSVIGDQLPVISEPITDNRLLITSFRLPVISGMAGGSLTIILYEAIKWLLTAYR